MDKEVLEMIIKGVLMIVNALVVAYVIPWIKEKVGANKLEELQKYAEWAVRSAEQLYTAEQWENKKKYALEYVAEKVGHIGLDLSLIDIEALVESTVNYIKYGQEYTK